MYAWKLVPTDKPPTGKRDDISLREKVKEILRDLNDGIDTIGKKMTVCQLYYVDAPKTKNGVRQIPMSKKVYQALKRAVKNRGKAAPVNIGGYTNFLFLNQSGLPKTASCYESMFQGLVRKYNKHHKPDEALPNITPHTMRHTFCTRLAQAGMNPKDLQYIMGHSNITMTLNYYAHADYASAKAAMDKLAA